MAYNIRKNWVTSFDAIVAKPIVLLPFVIIAFLEALALEVLYFFPRRPLADLAAPIVRKFAGDVFLHYPANLVLLPNLFYWVQLLIYVFLGVMLMGVTVNIFANIKAATALKLGTLAKSALKRYPSFLGFGLIMFAVLFYLPQLEKILFNKIVSRLAADLPGVLLKLMPFIFTVLLFLTNVIMQVFLIFTIPLIVIKGKPLIIALFKSVKLGLRHFVSVFGLIFFPLLIYLPIIVLKSDLPRFMEKTFPEMNLVVMALGMLASIFVECLVILCAAQFLLDQDQPVFYK